MNKQLGKEVKPLPADASEAEIVRFLCEHDPEELERAGIMGSDPDRSDLEELLQRYLSEPQDAQLNIPLSSGAKELLQRLAQRQELDAASLARLWIIERLCKEACPS